DFVLNSNDRVIRVFSVKEDGPPEQLHKFQDLVNRIQWNQCCLSSDSDYVIGGSAHQAAHNIYIWDKIGGNLVKILEGPKEPLEDVAWHPVRPIVASVSNYGTIHIWATNYQENWSAFAPDFKELEENIDYEEREDEFDIVPEEEVTKRKHDDEEVEIDVTTIEKINPFNDSDSEDEEETFYLPLLPSDQQDEKLLQEDKRRNRRRRHVHHQQQKQQKQQQQQQQQQQQHPNESSFHNRRHDHESEPSHHQNSSKDISPSTSTQFNSGDRHDIESNHEEPSDSVDPTLSYRHRHQNTLNSQIKDERTAMDYKKHDRDWDRDRDEYEHDSRHDRPKHKLHKKSFGHADTDSAQDIDSEFNNDHDRNTSSKHHDRDHERNRDRDRDRDRDRERDHRRIDDQSGRSIKRQK
ncbi:hypothetical protein BGZ94_000289, partial [Podila epigama]